MTTPPRCDDCGDPIHGDWCRTCADDYRDHLLSMNDGNDE